MLMFKPHPEERRTVRPAGEAPVYDLLVIGGGVNGAGIANDAAGRGLSVLLCEQHDLASHTSSASSKLVHGGLRYLEHYEFRLVREALGEREVLLQKAPHIIWPLRFVLPHRPHLRPRWMLRAGLFLYDHLGKRTTLPGSTGAPLNGQGPLNPQIDYAFEYSDCWADDARLVVLNAVQAASLGADIRTYTRCESARRKGDLWQIELLSDHGTAETVHARALVNAAGPWAARVMERVVDTRSPYGVRLVQGSHIVVPQLYHGRQAYILQNEDERIVFVLPYENDYSLIGTTDVDYQGDPAQVEPTEAEVDYLLQVVNAHFKRQLKHEDIRHRFSGVRPLISDASESDPSAVSRDYSLTLEGDTGQAPLLAVYGGKLTTFRTLAEAAVDKLKPWFPDAHPSWTASHALAGGDFESQAQLSAELKTEYPWLTEQQLERFVRCYGTLSQVFLRGMRSQQDMGEQFGAGLTEREIKYLREREWARDMQAILWRRTKLGLHLNAAQQARLADYLQALAGEILAV
ncbi:glycerol-3-phosphate dehydrogenase [Halopseudomonas sabulinigri]|uniref:Glycerol-3-phosphate dehydrogenase n=2 Tax=Halopseudomonas sabulinigri TaxID=472181 RepID=A0ABP9ZQ07_9GAMM